MKGKERYPDLDNEKRYLEYVLEILHHCLHPDGHKKAEEMILEVETDAKENYSSRSKQIERAKEKFSILKKYKEKAWIVKNEDDPETIAYYETFRAFRDIFMENI